MDGLTHTKQLLNLLCIVYIQYFKDLTVNIELLDGHLRSDIEFT